MADVAVLSNRTQSGIAVDVIPVGEARRTLTIPAGDSRPVFFSQGVSVRFGTGLVPQTFPLSTGSAYFFKPGNGFGGNSLVLEKIGLGESDLQAAPPALSNARQAIEEVVTIPVTIAVDDDEPTHRSIWEPRLRERVAAASRILEQNCGVRLEVVAVTTWDSDDQTHNFSLSMREFEHEVPQQGSRLVIGFSSQYELATGRVHMGGSRGTLHPYILLKERARNVREPHRLELLVHELGHFFGATHSPEANSVMRPLFNARNSPRFRGVCNSIR